MVQVTFYYGDTGVQKVVWDVEKYKIKHPKKLMLEWKADLGATDAKMERFNS
jgi:hypothetical protein